MASNNDVIPEAKGVLRIDLLEGYVTQKVTSERRYFRAIGDLDIKLNFMPPSLINFISRQLIGSGFRLYQKSVVSKMNDDKELGKALTDLLYVRTREALYNTDESNVMDEDELKQFATIFPAKELSQSKQDWVKNMSRKAYLAAFSASSYSYISLLKHFLPIMNEGGSSLSLTYIVSERIIPEYGGGMSSNKSALESDTRVLAFEASRKKRIRVNTILAGPLGNRVVKAIGYSKEFNSLMVVAIKEACWKMIFTFHGLLNFVFDRGKFWCEGKGWQQGIHISALKLLSILVTTCSPIPHYFNQWDPGKRQWHMTSDVKEVAGKSYDYIIVGGGTCGCPLAATLSEKFFVLLIERGGLMERGGSPYGNPLVVDRRYYSLPLIQKDNNHMSVPQRFTSKDGVSNVRGIVLGGSPQIAGITEDLKIIVEASTLPLRINKSRVNIAMPLSKGYLQLNNK